MAMLIPTVTHFFREKLAGISLNLQLPYLSIFGALFSKDCQD
jgi:hypothetical protein